VDVHVNVTDECKKAPKGGGAAKLYLEYYYYGHAMQLQMVALNRLAQSLSAQRAQQHPILIHLRPSDAAAGESAGELAVRVPLNMDELFSEAVGLGNTPLVARLTKQNRNDVIWLNRVTVCMAA
jgi:hypothetical protein